MYFNKNKYFKAIKRISDQSYLLYFIALAGVGFYAHYIAATILLYLGLVLYVLFINTPLFHRHNYMKHRIMIFVLLIFLFVISFIYVLDINYTDKN